MTLSRVLVSIFSALLLVILVGVFAVSVANSRRFLEAQLASHAQDTATALGLTLSSTADAGDPGAMRSLAEAVFDRGYYLRIAVLDRGGRAVVDLELPVQVKDVPGWFVARLPLSAPAGRADVMAGWQPRGEVVVVSHPGYAYAELWHNFTGILAWVAGAWVAGTLLIVLLLRLVLTHLRALEVQALAVADRDFPVMPARPRIRELRRVTDAMNRMTTKLKSVFADQAAFIEALQQQAFHDPVTGMVNRRHFEQRLRHLVKAPDEFTRGAVLLIHLQGFAAFNQGKGHAAGDDLLRKVGRAVAAACESGGEEHLAARLNGAEFGCIAVNTAVDDCEKMAGRILAAMGEIRRGAGAEGDPDLHIGMAVFTGCETAIELLTAADTALRQVRRQGGSGFQRYRSTICAPDRLPTPTLLRDLVERRLAAGEIELDMLPVVDTRNGGPIHREVLARLRDDKGEPLPAQLFLHLVEEMGRGGEFDRCVMAKVMESLSEPDRPGYACAVNLCPGSLDDDAFVDWLVETLERRPQTAALLSFELPERACVGALEFRQAAMERLIAAGARFGLDHFGLGSGERGFGYLIRLKLAYVKIDGAFIRGIADSADDRFFVRALTNICHGLDIEVYAAHVENREDLEVVGRLGVDGVQGRFVE